MWIAERRFKVMPHRKPSTGWKIICWYILRASVGLMPVLSTTCMKFASQHLLYFTNFSLLNLAIPFLTFHSQCIFSEQGCGGLLFCGARCGKTLWGAAPLPADGGRRICAVPQRSAVWEGDALLCFISFCCLYLKWAGCLFLSGVEFYQRTGKRISEQGQMPGLHLGIFIFILNLKPFVLFMLHVLNVVCL